MSEQIWTKRTSVALCAAIASTSLFAMSGCDDRGVATGLGVAAIGAGAAAIIIGNNNRNSYNNGYRNVCSTYYDYNGYPYRDCRNVYVGNYGENAVREAGILDSDHAAALTPEDFAAEFHISFESSTRLVNAFRLAKTGNNEGLVAMGLTTTDLNQMAQFNLPQSSGIDQLSRSLNTNVATTTGMLNRMRAWALSEKTNKCDEAKYSSEPVAKEFYESYCN